MVIPRLGKTSITDGKENGGIFVCLEYFTSRLQMSWLSLPALTPLCWNELGFVGPVSFTVDVTMVLTMTSTFLCRDYFQRVCL